MRYRSIGAGRAALSAVSLALEPAAAPADTTPALVFAALENGINTFHVHADDAERLILLGQAVTAIERGLVLIMLRIAPDAVGSGQAVAAMAALSEALSALRLGWVDAVVLEPAVGEPLHPSAVEAMQIARGERRLRFVGVGGEGPGVDAALAGGGLDVVSARYSLMSGWAERNRLKLAQERGQSVLGHGFWADALTDVAPAAAAKLRRSLFGLGRRTASREDGPAIAGGYEFMQETAGWTAQEIALAYALTEPALATVQVAADCPETLERLARTPERELPAGLSAQIEMARFAGTPRG